MKAKWPKVKLGELLKPIWREEKVNPSSEYRLLGARWYGGGLFIKEVCLGQQIRADRLYQVQKGDFVYNRLFAWKGSFALAGPESNGCYVSNEFPCFEVDQNGLASISTVLEMTNGTADLGEADDQLFVAEPRHGCWGVGEF